MEEEKLGFIPNEPGLHASDDEAQKIEDAIDTWKEKEEQRVCPSFKKMSYWETVSSCKSL